MLPSHPQLNYTTIQRTSTITQKFPCSRIEAEITFTKDKNIYEVIIIIGTLAIVTELNDAD